jgi:membrane-associated protein
MIPGVDLIEFIKWGGVLAVAIVIFAETGLLVGFFLPGDSLLFTAGFLTYAGILPVNIHLLVVILFIAAICGNSFGYMLGRRLGPHVFNKPDSRFFKKEYVKEAHMFYEKHGPKTIILAQFVPVVRTFTPVVAGVAKMRYVSFLIYNIIGAVFWAVGVTYLGYFLGSWFKSMGIQIDTILLPIVIVIVLLSVLPAAIHILRDRKRRHAFWNGLTSFFSSKR